MVKFSTCLALVISLCISATACAGKEAKTARIANAGGGGKISDAPSLHDVAMGLADFERRASLYSKDEWRFVLGYAHYRHGRLKEADEMFADLAPKMGIVSDHVTFYRAVIANRQGRSADALSLVDELAANYKDSVWTAEAKIERARAFIGLVRCKEARKLLDEYKKSVSRERAFDADLLIAKSFIESGDADGAINFVRALAISSDSEEKLAELADLMAEVKKRFRNDIGEWLEEPVQQYRLAQSFTDRSQWDSAAARLEKLLAHDRVEGAFKAEAKWLLARCLRSIHRYDEAIALMEGLLNDPTSSVFYESLLSTLATTYTKKNEYAKAIALRQKLMDGAPPNSGIAAQMAYKIAFLYMDEGKYKEAIPLWRKVVAMRGGGEKREQAQWYLAWCYYMTDPSEAVAMFDSMLKKSGAKSIDDRLMYWKGRALEKMGKKSEAREAYGEATRERPGGYYWELASRRIKDDKRTVENFTWIKSAPGPLGPWAPGEEKSAPGKQEQVLRGSGAQGHLGRAEFFDRLGLREEAAREIRAAPIDGSATLLDLAARNFAHDAVYRFAEGRYHNELKDTPPDGAPRHVWEAAYPMAYDPLVERLTRDGAVDPMIVWSIMRNESNFRPEIVSPAGAVGLMQLMPTTASRLSQDAGEGAVDRRDLYRPAANIGWGAAYLKKLARMFPENPVAWIASYNAGEEAVERWQKNGQSPDIEEWIEEIPYDETNLYVKKVLVSYWKYQRLYEK